MPTAKINGRNIFYADTGGAGPAVVFSHGLLMDHEMFAPQVAALRGQYRCISWDERGHGLTATEVLEPFSYYDSADDLAGLLEHLGIERAVLAGMSQGGFLSLRCALTHPEVVTALVLLDSQAGREDPEAFAGYSELSRQWQTHGLSKDIADIVEHAILGDGWSGAGVWRAKWALQKPVNLAGCMRTLGERDDITAKLPRIAVPCLVVHGDADAAIPLERARILADGLPDAELVVVPGAGHAANLTHPEIVNPAIARFLARVIA
jgi:pimeloyl-ACP methyl ester carboxylesterase